MPILDENKNILLILFLPEFMKTDYWTRRIILGLVGIKFQVDNKRSVVYLTVLRRDCPLLRSPRVLRFYNESELVSAHSSIDESLPWSDEPTLNSVFNRAARPRKHMK